MDQQKLANIMDQQKWGNIMEQQRFGGISSSILPVNVDLAKLGLVSGIESADTMMWKQPQQKWSGVENIPFGLQHVGINIPSDMAITQKIPVSVSFPGQVPFKAPSYSYANLVPGMQYSQLTNAALPVNVRPTTFSQLPVISNSMLGLASTQMNTVQQAPTTTEQTTFIQNQPIVRSTMMSTLPLQQIVNTQLPKFALGSAQHFTTLSPMSSKSHLAQPKLYGLSSMENQLLTQQADQLNFNMLNQA